MNQFVQIIWNEHLFQSTGKKYIIEKDNRTGLQHNSFHEEEFVLAAQFNVHSHIMTHLLTLKSIKTWKIKVKQATNSIPLLPFRIKLTFYSVTHKNKTTAVKTAYDWLRTAVDERHSSVSVEAAAALRPPAVRPDYFSLNWLLWFLFKVLAAHFGCGGMQTKKVESCR